MNRVVEILMERDGMTKNEAEKLINETREVILEGDPFEAEDIVLDMLGLEMDYIIDLF